jgi:ABC-type polysaccharide/polyol phosphate export permease
MSAGVMWPLIYLVVALLVWVLAAGQLMRHERTDDGEAWVVAVTVGMLIAMVWPVTLLGFGVYRLARATVGGRR